MSNVSEKDEAVWRFIEENPDVRDMIYDIATMRRQFDYAPDPGSVSADHSAASVEESLRQRRERYAALLLPASIGLAGKAVGREAREAYMIASGKDGRSFHCDRARALDQLAGRLRLLDYLLPETGEEGEITIQDAVLELAAISRGDDPRHFAKLDLGPNSRRRSNAFRLAVHQLNALKWDAYFRAAEMPPKEVKLLVGAAFGEDHTTYERWPDRVRKELGETWFNWFMGNARNRPHIFASDLDEAKEALQRDGAAYRAELRQRAA